MRISVLAISGNMLFSSSGIGDAAIQARHVETPGVFETLTGHSMPVTTLLFSGGLLFSGSYDTTVRT
jgi:hypothetical protein